MRRILLVAKRDYLATVRTKAFMIGLVVAPILFSGGLIAVALTKANPDLKDHRVAIVDRTGLVAASIIQAAGEKNARELFNKRTGKQIAPRYVFEVLPPDNDHADKQRLLLSDRVRSHGLFAFIEIAPEALHPGKDPDGDQDEDRDKEKARKLVSCYTNASAMDFTRNWMNDPVNEGIRRVRLAQLGVDSSHFADVLGYVPVDSLNLVSRDEKTGEIRAAHKVDEMASFMVPFGMMMLLGMIVMMGASPMMAAVTEDKAQRIVEMLLGLATPFELMMGKVVSAIGISLTSSALYVFSATVALYGMGLAGLVPFHLFPWFYVYLLADVTMLCALGAGLGAACSTPQDAQSLMMILVAPVVIPYIVMVQVIQQPNGMMATAMSLFPPFTPMLMLLRQAMPGGTPAWQPWVGLVGVVTFTLAAVWAAARIFRVGILMQGKSPKLAEIARWAVRG